MSGERLALHQMIDLAQMPMWRQKLVEVAPIGSKWQPKDKRGRPISISAHQYCPETESGRIVYRNLKASAVFISMTLPYLLEHYYDIS